MAKGKKSSQTTKLILILLAVLALVVVGFYFAVKPTKHKILRKITPVLSSQDYASLLVQAAVWYPSAPWTRPAATTESTPLGNIKGQFIKATISSNQAVLSHFEDPNYLSSQGYSLDNTLAADGPGSSTWGYSKETNGKKYILLFSYKTKASNAGQNQPLEFICPCDITVTVFTNDTPDNSSQISNPASVNCAQKGGTLSIEKNGTGGEYGLCNFEDNMSCEEWALLRGDCPVGGVKTTGYDTVDQMYCAWTGGTTLAVPDSMCQLPDGTKCSTLDHYNGKC